MLQVRDLHVSYPGVDAVRGVSITVHPGQVLALVGESGSGKSSLARAVGGLLTVPGAASHHHVSGSVQVGSGPNLLQDEDSAQAAVAEQIAVAVQGAALNPVHTLGEAIAEPLRRRRRASQQSLAEQVSIAADAAGLPTELLGRYPHEVSGGQARRAVVAAALTLTPPVLILDEPTAGLDPAGARDLLRRTSVYAREHQTAVLIITHALADAHLVAHDVAVLYAGRVCEYGPTDTVLSHPRHPYTAALLAATPVLSTTVDLRPIPGVPPDAREVPTGCAFHPRCPQAIHACRGDDVPLTPVVREENAPTNTHLNRPAPTRQPSARTANPASATPGVTAEGVEAAPRPATTPAVHEVACVRGGLLTRLHASNLRYAYGSGGTRMVAVRDASLRLEAGQSCAVIGSSGSGKSTLAALLAGHLRPFTGWVRCDGEPATYGWDEQARHRKRLVQLVPQDPWAAFSPRLTMRASLLEAVETPDAQTVAGDGTPSTTEDTLTAALTDVGLAASEHLLQARPGQLSGGQLQRLSVARALLARPSVLVADEPTSMLDPSEASRIAHLLRTLQGTRGLSVVLITHDVALARKVCDQLVVMDGGHVVERGSSAVVCQHPQHPATRALLEAAPRLPLGAADAVSRAGTTPTLPTDTSQDPPPLRSTTSAHQHPPA